MLIVHNNYTYAGTRSPLVEDQKHIEYAEKFNCVGQIVGIYNDGSLFLASGVAIDSHHVLTAAHVVQNSRACYFVLGKKKFFLSKVTYHKQFKEENFGKNDIAIGYSDEDISLEAYPPLYHTDDETAKHCDIAGYGFHGTFKTGAVKIDEHKRAGTNIVEYIVDDILVCSASQEKSETFTDLEFIIASGDSGGGLFIDGKLAGINSCVMSTDHSPNSSYSDESCHTRISKYLDWIKENSNP